MPSVLAIAAHPDDIEYVMAGTMLRLGALGWDLHYFNLSTGHCGSLEMDAETTASTRLAEAMEAARRLGAAFHPPMAGDLEIIYSVELLRQVASVVRAAAPSIVLTHSPQDYMEDHMETARLAVTAAFAKNMPNFTVVPPRPPVPGDVMVYHAMPHGLHDGLRQPIHPDVFVDVSAVQETKLAALSAHRSQQHWLQSSQGMNSYLKTLVDQDAAVGRLSGRFAAAEGWRRHSHLGFSLRDHDPLTEALG